MYVVVGYRENIDVITEFRIGVAHTMNLGNYESMRIEASVTYSVEEGEDTSFLKTHAQQELKNLCRETYLAQRRVGLRSFEEERKKHD